MATHTSTRITRTTEDTVTTLTAAERLLARHAADSVAQAAAADLTAIREQWGDLLLAIDSPPAAEWPPREARGFLDQLATDDHAHDDEPAGRVGRLPLTLRDHPAPINLDALDAAVAVERALFDLADQIAEQVQRPIRTGRDPKGRFTQDQADAADPARWHYQAPTSPGSRAYGLHWAACWIEGRLLGEAGGDLFTTVPLRLLDHAATTTASARRAIERALGRDGRTTTLTRRCPWCTGPLTARTRSGGEPLITCSTGAGCGAPVMLDRRGRRAWGITQLPGLLTALAAADR